MRPSIPTATLCYVSRWFSHQSPVSRCNHIPGRLPAALPRSPRPRPPLPGPHRRVAACSGRGRSWAPSPCAEARKLSGELGELSKRPATEPLVRKARLSRLPGPGRAAPPETAEDRLGLAHRSPKPRTVHCLPVARAPGRGFRMGGARLALERGGGGEGGGLRL